MGDDARSVRPGPQRRLIRTLARIFGTALLTLNLLVAAGSLPGQSDSALSSGGGPDLPLILTKAAEYCEKLDRAALYFVCHETITERFRPDARPGFPSSGHRRIVFGATETHHYVYDYQLIRSRAGVVKESRTLLKEDGKDVKVPEAALKTSLFWHAKVVMGPLGLLSREHQADHDFRIVREEKYRGDTALVLEAVPKPGIRLQHLFGTIWLRKKDAGILKIEWNPASIDNYQGVEETAKRLNMTPRLLVISEYAYEKNSIRFPSRYTVKEIYSRGESGRRFERSEIDVVYDQYKFFRVETDVKF
jgi:hypothetical protein